MFEEGDIRVRVLPESEKVLIGACSPVAFPEQAERSPQLQVRQRADRISKHDAAMVQNFSEFRRRFPTAPGFKVRQTAHIGGIEPSEFGEEGRAWHREIVGKRRLKPITG